MTGVPEKPCLECHENEAWHNVRSDRRKGMWVVTGSTTVGLYCRQCAVRLAAKWNGE